MTYNDLQWPKITYSKLQWPKIMWRSLQWAKVMLRQRDCDENWAAIKGTPIKAAIDLLNYD